MNNFWSEKTFLVTGAAGFIGSHLSVALLQQGAKVIGVDNFLSSSPENLAAIKAELPASQAQNLTFVEADVNQPPESYLPADLNLAGIFHFASPASPPVYQKYPRETYLVNSWATHQLLDYLRVNFVQARFLFAGTSEAYGDPKIHPQTEIYWGNVNPNGLRSCYDEAKRLGETICGVHARDFGLDARIIRIFNTYGPRMDLNDGRVIPSFIKSLLNHQPLTVFGDGSQTRSYCYVSDLVAGILAMMSKPKLAGETINLGNPGEFTILETAQLVHQVWQELTGQNQPLEVENLPLPADDPTRRQPDITKAKKLLGWQPTVDFKAGLKDTIQYFLTQSAQA